MNKASDPKEQRIQQKQKLRQKQTLRFVIAGSITAVLTTILIIYINLNKVDEVKAVEETVQSDSTVRPSDLAVEKVLVAPESKTNSERNYKIARPLQRDTIIN